MKRAGHEDVNFFIGREIEHTPAYNHKTLFVVGLQVNEQVVVELARNHNCTHVYFGANHSFPNPDINDGATWSEWEDMITESLTHGLLCTLDLDIKSAEGLVESGLIEYNNFIPMISVKLPYIQLLGYNATLKLDDKDFAATNPGVWCHSLHELRDRTKFTDWSQYTKDETIG
jgi:hypothetical protein